MPRRVIASLDNEQHCADNGQSKTQYVQHGQNGIVMEHVGELKQQLHFYLDGLNNWNEAVVGCYEIGQKFTTKVLLDAWSEVLRTIG